MIYSVLVPNRGQVLPTLLQHFKICSILASAANVFVFRTGVVCKCTTPKPLLSSSPAFAALEQILPPGLPSQHLFGLPCMRLGYPLKKGLSGGGGRLGRRRPAALFLKKIGRLGCGDGIRRCRLCSHILCHQFQPMFSPFSLKINQILLESTPNLNFLFASIQ